MVQPAFVLELHPEREALVDRALELFQPMSARPLTRDDAREAIDNLVGAYLILLRARARRGGAK